MTRTEEILKIRDELENASINLLAQFQIHGEDGICISDVEDALIELKGTIYKLETLMK